MPGLDEEKIQIIRSLVAIASALAVVGWYMETLYGKKRRHHSYLSGTAYVRELLADEGSLCLDHIRMNKDCFLHLCNAIVARGLLRKSLGLTVEEQLVMFLNTIGHNVNQSGEIGSRHFNRVLDAIIHLSPDYMKQPGPNIPSQIESSPKFFPYFKDCVGAIDGTHIPAKVDAGKNKETYRNCKGFLSQNVLAATGFDLIFQYALGGWEGSASDSLVLDSALIRENKLVVPHGKYFLVDAGYSHTPGFLAPYRSVRYHPKDFGPGSPPTNAKELFNFRHSTLRSAIECAFRVLKARFKILKVASRYPYKIQVRIVIACCILHNYICVHASNDEWLDTLGRSPDLATTSPIGRNTSDGRNLKWDGGSWYDFRDHIAEEMWEDYGRTRDLELDI